jgi:prepilin-type N-terminal cleavage/methylation domain-containing protein
MPRQRAGFTLIELMIVITIMGTMAAMIAPGIGEYLADSRASSASEALVRLSRHMQARTQQTGLAHMLLFTSSSNDGGGLGVVRVYEGMNNHCRQTPWPQTINGKDEDGHAPVDVLDMSSGDYNPSGSNKAPTVDDRERHVISLRVSGALGAPDLAAICIEPGGTVWEGAASSTMGAGFVFTKPIASIANKAITFTVSRRMNSAVRGRDRIVFFSTSGLARFRF